MRWTKETYNLMPLPEHIIRQIFVPLSEEEMKRLPPLWEKSECKPSQELLPRHTVPQQQRILKPTREDIIASVLTNNDNTSMEGIPTPPLSPQTKRLEPLVQVSQNTVSTSQRNHTRFFLAYHIY